MTIQKKIVLSNLIMVFVPILLAFVFVLLWIQTAGQKYWKPLEEMYEDRNGVLSAQNIIYAYQEELWATNWAEIEGDEEGKEADEPDAIQLMQTPKMTELRQELARMNYHFAVSIDGETVYSNLTESEIQEIRQIGGDVLSEADSVTLNDGKNSVIKSSFREDDETCAILAFNDGMAGSRMGKSYLQKYVIPYLWGFLALLLGIIVLVNFLCSRWLKMLLLPSVKNLRAGAKRVREGNLDEDIPVYRQDELGEVCSEFNEMQRYLKESAEERVRYESGRKELISGISHDLRTPLTTIKGYVSGLLDGIADTEEQREQYLKAIQVRALDMETLLNHLSAYNKQWNPEFIYHMERTDLASYIGNYLRENAAYVKENAIQISFEIEGENLQSCLDSQEFKRILDNLFSNTVRYREKAHSQISIRIEREDVFVSLTVTDDGPGVPDEAVRNIFDSFYRLDGSRTKCSEGSGLGLAIVKQIVTAHRGIVYAQSHHGLSIIMKFPAADQEADK